MIPPMTNENDLSLLRRIEANTVRASADGRACETVGPFFAAAHLTNDMIWLSYAVPLSSTAAAPTSHRRSTMREWFKRHDRRLRFEILEPLWPELADQLLACGSNCRAACP